MQYFLKIQINGKKIHKEKNTKILNKDRVRDSVVSNYIGVRGKRKNGNTDPEGHTPLRA